MRRSVFFIVLLSLLISLLSGCKGSFTQTRNDLPKDSKVGKSIFRAGQMTEGWFKQFEMYAYQSIGEDDDLNEQEKALESKRIEDMEYRENGILFFTMVNNIPMLDGERPVSFSVKDSKGTDYIKSTDLVKLKITQISQYGSTKSYNYTYIINTEVIDMDVIEPEKLPITLSAVFSNDKKIEYSLE